MDPLTGLSVQQRALIEAWLPGAAAVADHSWGLVATTVLELLGDQGRFIVKAGGPSDHHIAREIRAHRRWLEPWTSCARAPRLFAADEDAKLVVTHHLPGTLVQGHPAQDDPETYRQAGELLARLHGQYTEVSHHWNTVAAQRALRWFDRPHRIAPDAERALRAEIATWHDEAVTLVTTHGDWQPRNWLIDDGTVRVIDFGRFDLRPAAEDLSRLSRQDFARDPRLESAFFEGYGNEPREPELWRRTLVGEAIGTAGWAHGVGDEAFEQVGLRQIDQQLGT